MLQMIRIAAHRGRALPNGVTYVTGKRLGAHTHAIRSVTNYPLH